MTIHFIKIILFILTSIFLISCQSNYVKNPPDKHVDFQTALESWLSTPRPARTYTSIPTSNPDSAQPPSVAGKIANVEADAVVLEELLFTIAREAGIDLDLRTNLPNPVTISFHQRPIQELLQRLAPQGGFRFHWKNNTLVISDDSAFVKSYPLPALAIQRALTSHMHLATQVGDIATDSDRPSRSDNSSQTDLTSTMVHDLWASSVRTIKNIVQADKEAINVTAQPEAGLIVVRATQSQHRDIANYLATLRAAMNRQVLIEARVIEVQLDRSHQQGVDWRAVAALGSGLSLVQQLIPGGPDANTSRIAPTGLFTWKDQTQGHDLQATLKLLGQYGQVNVLSSPRIQTMHQQPALMKVVDNHVYFQTGTERSYDSNGNLVLQTTGTQVRTVAVGIVLNVLPSIDTQGYITLALRPTITRILGYRNIPDPDLAAASGIVNAVPELQVREMEAVLRIADGETAVLGGLIQSSANTDTQTLPGLSDLPVLGNLFENKEETVGKSELLILIRATQINNLI